MATLGTLGFGMISFGMSNLVIDLTPPSGGGGVEPAPSVGLAMTQLPSGRVYQRTTKVNGMFGKGQGSITVSITLQAAADTIEYRLRDAEAADRPTVKDWSTAAVNVPANATSVACPNVPANAAKYLLDLRANGDNAQRVLGTSPIMMGRIMAGSGQSQMVRQFAKMPEYAGTIASFGVAVSPYGMIYATVSDPSLTIAAPAWELPSDSGLYGATFAAEFLRRQVDASGVACAFVGHAVGATQISEWAANSANRNKLNALLDAVGGFEAFYWHQGGNDAGAGTTDATYQAALSNLFTNLAAHNGVLANDFVKLVTAMATRLSNGAGTVAQVRTIRGAAKRWAADNGAIYLEPHDVNLEDAVHQGQGGNIVLAHHAHRALRPSLGLVGGDEGPTFGVPTRAADSALIEVPITLPAGATDLVLTGNPATRIAVYKAGDTTAPLALAGSQPVAFADGKLSIRLATNPGPTALDVYLFGHPDPSQTLAFADMIRDNHLDGDGITVGRSLTPTIDPIAVANPGGAVVEPPAAGTVLASDAFTAANGTNLTSRKSDSGHDWSTLAGTFLISGNEIYGSAQGSALIEAGLAHADYDVEARMLIRTVVAAQNWYVMSRVVDASNHYLGGYYRNTGQLVIARLLNGSITVLVGLDYTPQAGNTPLVRLRAKGDKLSLFLDGTKILETTDASHSAVGKAGIRSSGANVGNGTGTHIDDFRVLAA